MDFSFPITPAFLVLVGIFGLAIGSFLNVVIFRHEKRASLRGRSHCPHCKHIIHWYELVPVLSYMLQRGACRTCHTRISPQYPLVELGTAVLFVLVAYRTNSLEHYSLVSFLFGIGIWSVLMVITVYDLRTKLIPDLFNALFAGAALLLLLFSVCVGMHTPTEAIQWFVTGVALYLPFYALWKVSRGRWIGLGDGKLALGIGWFLGPIGGPSAVLFAFWAGAAISLLFIGLQQVYLYYQHSFSKKTALTLKSEIPFGPFLVLGVAIVYFTHITIFTLF